MFELTERQVFVAGICREQQLYVVGWPTEGVVKVGWTMSGKRRWGRFIRTGASLIFAHAGETAGPAEDSLQKEIRKEFPRAFFDPSEAAHILPTGGGYSECFKVPPSSWERVVELAKAAV